MNSTTPPTNASTSSKFKPLRIWGLLILLPLMYLIRKIPDLVEDGPSGIWMFSAFGPALISLVILAWWVFFSRARWFERLLGPVFIVTILVAQQILCHYSLRGPLVIVMTLPITVATFAIAAILLRNWLSFKRTLAAAVLAFLAASTTLFLKSDGVHGDFTFDLRPRWQKSFEDSLETQVATAPSSEAVVPVAVFDQATWPSFRGAKYDGAYSGCEFDSDWTKNPPQEVWRHEVGAAWSSFVAAGNFLFTQEQLGENESVVCYAGETGTQVWHYDTPSRFFEGLGGLGPRATPALSGTALYSLGAEGWLLKLDASTGKEIWKVNIKEISERKDPPMWGFSSSPLVAGNKVVVHAGGKEDKGILAFNTEDGKLLWSTAAGEQSYGSPQVVQLLNQTFISLLSEQGAHFYEPESGKLVHQYDWQHNGYRALQPQIIDGDKLLIATGMGAGTRLVQFKLDDQGAMTTEDLWTCKDFKPDFNDFVIYQGHIYGFDARIFACIDLQTGKRKWRGGRYEKGQALLLADSGLIVVIGEMGELVLLRATPEKHEELGKIPALSDKTWNHPIVVGDKLFVRNAKEAVCYRLKVK